MKTAFLKRDTNIVKGIAIIFLLIHHCFLSPGRYKNIEVSFAPFTESQVGYIAAFLKICVGMFVFLTAFGITISLKNRYGSLNFTGTQAKTYTLHRLKNLFTGWIFVFVLCEVFCMVYSGLPMEIYGANAKGIIRFLLDGLGVANLFGTPTLLGTWWYMSLAITLIFVIPVLIFAYRNIGFWYLAGLFVILSRQLHMTDVSLIHWTPAVLLGIACADKGWLVKMSNYQLIKKSETLNKIIKLILGIAVLCAMVKFRQSGMSAVLFEIKDGVIPFFIIYFCYEFICGIPIVSTALEFIGKYSMNIFLTHTLIRATYFRKFIYGFYYAPLIVIVLLVISLAVAVAIELLKKISGYNLLKKKVL